jgi:hypothetical protein
VPYTAKIDLRTVSSTKPFVVVFRNGEVLEFETQKEAKGFARFYSSNAASVASNPALVYGFEKGEWVEIRVGD